MAAPLTASGRRKRSAGVGVCGREVVSAVPRSAWPPLPSPLLSAALVNREWRRVGAACGSGSGPDVGCAAHPNQLLKPPADACRRDRRLPKLAATTDCPYLISSGCCSRKSPQRCAVDGLWQRPVDNLDHLTYAGRHNVSKVMNWTTPACTAPSHLIKQP